MFQEFPKWIYHKELPAQIVESSEAQVAAGPEWKETPAAFIAAVEPTMDELMQSEFDKAEADHDIESADAQSGEPVAKKKTRGSK
jgi:hypothetical protein